MVGLAQVLVAAALVAMLVWVFGGLALRLGGWIALASGLVTAMTAGGAIRAWEGVGVAAAGGLVWLAGQAHFATRHQFYASLLARRLFGTRLFRRVDPTASRRTTRPVTRLGTEGQLTPPAGATAPGGEWPSTPQRRRRLVGRSPSGVWRSCRRD